MEEPGKTGVTTQRIAGRLHRVVPILDAAGEVIHFAVKPLMVELRVSDLMQILVGAAILATPVGFTEETWKLGETLPFQNVLALGLISILVIAAFVYFNIYRHALRGHEFEYAKRVVAIYGLSLIVVGLLLTLVQQCPWGINNLLAIKRIVIVAFPASMSAAVADMVDR
jgi:uncharacterized membrane protein